MKISTKAIDFMLAFHREKGLPEDFINAMRDQLETVEIQSKLEQIYYSLEWHERFVSDGDYKPYYGYYKNYTVVKKIPGTCISDQKPIEVSLIWNGERVSVSNHPIFTGCLFNDIEAVTKIIMSDNSIKNKASQLEKETPLMIAVLGRAKDVVKYLINENVDITAVNIYDMNALHLAALIGDLDSIRILCKNAINIDKSDFIDKKDKNGCTPLFYAVKYGKIEAAQALYEAGACVYDINQGGQNIFDLFPDSKFTEELKSKKRLYTGGLITSVVTSLIGVGLIIAAIALLSLPTFSVAAMLISGSILLLKGGYFAGAANYGLKKLENEGIYSSDEENLSWVTHISLCKDKGQEYNI